MRLLAVVIAAAVLAPLAAAGPSFGTTTIRLGDGTRTTPLRVQVADTGEERGYGLMNRRTVEPYGGMLFVFDAPSEGAFWMKNTLIPLTIAFADARGRILRVLDMTPCTRDPCKLYPPGVAYRMALEVPRGALREVGVGRGDRIVVPPRVVAAAR